MTTNIPIDGRLLCHRMAERGLTAVSLARISGVSAPTIRRGMAGGARLQAEKVLKIGRALESTPPIPELVALMAAAP